MITEKQWRELAPDGNSYVTYLWVNTRRSFRVSRLNEEPAVSEREKSFWGVCGHASWDVLAYYETQEEAEQVALTLRLSL